MTEYNGMVAHQQILIPMNLMNFQRQIAPF